MTTKLDLITCVVQRGKAHEAVQAAIEVGAQGATIYNAMGTGIREKIGPMGKLIDKEKEVILIATMREQTQKVFDTLAEVARLHQPGQGFAFVHVIDQAVGFCPFIETDLVSPLSQPDESKSSFRDR